MATSLTRSAVRVYGALQGLGNNTGSIMEGLLPFFDPILRVRNHERLDPDAIAQSVRETYKWNFNSDLVEAFVPYLEQQGWIVRELSDSRNTLYTIQMDDNGGLDKSAETVQNELRQIALSFKEFSENLSPLTAIPREVEEFEDILVEWLLYVEAFSEKSIGFTSSLRPDQSGTIRKIVEIPKTTSLKDEERFLCARFVKHTVEENEDSAQVLARIAAIGLLTEVVQDFVKPVTAIDKCDLVVYLDGPVALELLGVSGKSAKENTTPVVSELIRIGASVRIFGQSLDEIKNSLRAVLSNPQPTGPTAQAMRKGEVLREYVVEVSHDPGRFLEEIGVKTAFRTIDQTPSEHKYFTDDSREDLYSRLSYAENPHARQHDTDITTFVVRQRLGRTSRDIFKSHAVVLTRNGLLAQVVRKICNEATGQSEHVVPPVIHRRTLATAMWLRTGLGAGDLNIPKRMLLASCEQVLAIRPGVIETVKRLTDALNDDEKTRQLDLLISQDRSAQALMDKTLGLSNVITEENLPLLWQEMLHPHLEEERKMGQIALKEAKAAASDRQKATEQQLAEFKQASTKTLALRDAELAIIRSEDREAVEALCTDVQVALRRKRMVRVLVGVGVAIVFSAPLLMETTPMVRWSSFVVGIILAYMTATGGKLLGVNTDETRALDKLHAVGARRKLGRKLDQFNIAWEQTHFVVTDRLGSNEAADRRDLFS